MNKILAVAILGTSITLGGCASMGGGAKPTIQDLLVQAQQAAVAACGFMPALNTVANIVAAGNPGVMTASAIASAICAAVAPSPKAARLHAAGRIATVNGWQVAPGTVNGVRVR